MNATQPCSNIASWMACFDGKYEYSDWARMSTRAPRSRIVMPARPCSAASAQAAEQLATVTAGRWQQLGGANTVSRQTVDEKTGDLTVRIKIVTPGQITEQHDHLLFSTPRAKKCLSAIADARGDVGGKIAAKLVSSTLEGHCLADGAATVNELAAPFELTLPAVSKHIKVLEAAGVVSQRREGRHRPVHLEAERVVAATSWLASRVREMDARFERLDDLLTELQRGDHR